MLQMWHWYGMAEKIVGNFAEGSATALLDRLGGEAGEAWLRCMLRVKGPMMRGVFYGA